MSYQVGITHKFRIGIQICLVVFAAFCNAQAHADHPEIQSKISQQVLSFAHILSRDVKAEEDRGRYPGGKSLFYQAIESNHCEYWVEALRPSIDSLRTEYPGIYATFYPVLTDGYTFGTLHILYVGFVFSSKYSTESPEVFTFDPWRGYDNDFRILRPDSSGVYRIPGTSSEFKYDSIYKALYYTHVPPETLINLSLAVELGSGETIDIPGIDGKPYKRMSIPEAISARAPTMAPKFDMYRKLQGRRFKKR